MAKIHNIKNSFFLNIKPGEAQMFFFFELKMKDFFLTRVSESLSVWYS